MNIKLNKRIASAIIVIVMISTLLMQVSAATLPTIETVGHYANGKNVSLYVKIKTYGTYDLPNQLGFWLNRNGSYYGTYYVDDNSGLWRTYEKGKEYSVYIANLPEGDYEYRAFCASREWSGNVQGDKKSFTIGNPKPQPGPKPPEPKPTIKIQILTPENNNSEYYIGDAVWLSARTWYSSRNQYYWKNNETGEWGEIYNGNPTETMIKWDTTGKKAGVYTLTYQALDDNWDIADKQSITITLKEKKYGVDIINSILYNINVSKSTSFGSVKGISDSLKRIKLSYEKNTYTFCNFYVQDVMYYLGLRNNSTFPDKLAETYDLELKNHTETWTKNWTAINAYEAQQKANAGYVVIGTAQNPKGSGDGHIVIIRAESDKLYAYSKDGKYYPVCAQAGASVWDYGYWMADNISYWYYNGESKSYTIPSRTGTNSEKIQSNINTTTVDNYVNSNQAQIEAISISNVHQISHYYDNVIDIEGGYIDTGVRAVLYPAHSGDNQKFNFEKLSDGSYKITAVHSGKVLAPESSSHGAQVTQQDWSGSDLQKWYLYSRGNGWYKIVNKKTGYCLDDYGGLGGTLDSIVQWEDNDTFAQWWKLD